ncbi:pumilio-family RNA binding repeat protein [Pyricularia oryzae Y34]|uniref:Pumilio-family RNA binding repeat protein n=1 Tax=Pyricularia oryzae (strain Y34) TaxID=1143189 RepID=A0AA97P7E8_PYRO3|nr:pumilio-family RNA binding repeat protein [Pyricularia oryzae Y34]
MSVPRARLLQLMKAQCEVFSTAYNPEGVRTGNKILRQRLRGPALAAYYPRRVVTLRDLRKELGQEFMIEDEAEEDRLLKIEELKARGKGAPKKKKGPASASVKCPERVARQSSCPIVSPLESKFSTCYALPGQVLTKRSCCVRHNGIGGTCNYGYCPDEVNSSTTNAPSQRCLRRNTSPFTTRFPRGTGGSRNIRNVLFGKEGSIIPGLPVVVGRRAQQFLTTDIGFKLIPGQGENPQNPSSSGISVITSCAKLQALCACDQASLIWHHIEASTGRQSLISTCLQPHLDFRMPVNLKKSVSALTTSKLANQSSAKKAKLTHDLASSESYPMDRLLAKLSEHQAVNTQHNVPIAAFSDDEQVFPRVLDHQSSCSSLPITPANDIYAASTPATRPASATPESHTAANDEVTRLKLELARAKSEISRLDSELINRRTEGIEGNEDGLDQVDKSILGMTGELGGPRFSGSSTYKSSRPQYARETPWPAQDDSPSDTSDSLSAGNYGRSRGIWASGKNSNANQSNYLQPTTSALSDPTQQVSWSGGGRGFAEPCAPLYGPTADTYRGDRFGSGSDMGMRAASGRRSNRYDNRFATPQSFEPGFGGFTMGYSQFDSVASYQGGLQASLSGGLMSHAGGMHQQFQQPVGTPLSPHATEFTSNVASSWKSDAVATEGQTYLPTTEPLNYRRLLDRNVNCNWKYIVDKIVCNNDQQASIFLQQKLKVGTPEQKYEIVEAIVAQAYPLMVNRFGNFLVQRCFEHGTPEQVIKIAEAIRGNTLNLSMDPFGCHVVQKAFDSVPEDYKAIMVGELLRRIPETVIHRYACHVWQKLFELRWTESPPQIMKFVNDALHGMWHEVALGETGSLVVQNIFENCLEDDKRPCIEEVLANIDIVAHGQFGNWCIQHICEHGAPADRSRAIDHVIRYAAEYSMDQFASKVVEKCLKIGGSDFLGRYLDRVCEGRVDRPRIPLIDIASDQYGNYLIQYILTHSTPQHREIVAAHIRKHMVSLRGSKFGSRVGMLCTNPAVATRPGPGVGPAMGRMPPGSRFGGAYR